ncbi:sugar phosphate isomerase/epimerase family protein [Methylobacterium oryzihabitans]|uniref:Sugar phosphate isomerase/epimerase n=1 Tax=Methylobacterium oryzihabitans TaxID=2499852 RepID=A0A437NYU2_9HYPH|nr:sugar phosphate isomerase/epimerase family protein [Methylobacterium oryzihabitans]RVU15174.1 sugar phosphate isomerase/epimerase [Methylobacterium oryzihabitans]
MTDPGIFAVNTYAYTLDRTALDCVNRLADQGYGGVELMMHPGHLWPAELDAGARRAIRRACEARGLPVVATNMPNVDINVAAASAEMRDYSLGLLTEFLRLSGDIGAPAIVVGPGKANPLFPAPRAVLTDRFHAALDRLGPVAEAAGVRLLLENMPFAFLPDAPGMMAALDAYGDPRIGVIYDVANAHFIGEDPAEGLRTVSPRLGLVHVSDTGRAVYRHDPVGRGDVPFAAVPPVLAEIGHRGRTVIEVISPDPDADIRDSAARLAALGYRWEPDHG